MFRGEESVKFYLYNWKCIIEDRSSCRVFVFRFREERFAVF